MVPNIWVPGDRTDFVIHAGVLTYGGPIVSEVGGWGGIGALANHGLAFQTVKTSHVLGNCAFDSES